MNQVEQRNSEAVSDSKPLSQEVVGKGTGMEDIEGLPKHKGSYTFGPKGVLQTLLSSKVNIDNLVSAFEKDPKLSGRIDDIINNWDEEKGKVSKVIGDLFPAYATLEKTSLGMIKGLVDIAAK